MSWQTALIIFSCILVSVRCQKNILFLVADDLRPNLGAYYDANSDIFIQPPMYTPHLDALAAKSLLFEKAYDAQALCSPSRTSTLTSRRPDTTRILRIGYYWREYGGNFTTLPQFFKEKGYTTIGAGKVFHGGPSSNKHDCKYSWSLCPFHESPDRYEDQKNSWNAIPKDQSDAVPLQDTANANWIMNKLREAAKQYQDDGTPFFIAYGAHKPHTPWVFPEEFLDYYPEDSLSLPDNPNCPINLPETAWSDPPIFRQFKDCLPETLGIPNLGEINVTIPDWKTKELRRAYYAAVSYSDHEIGRVLEYLETLGVADDTIIVFWGDHGWQLGEHAEWCKQNLFEITNRVPFMIRIPGVTDDGMRTKKAVELVDLFPTLVEAAGFESLPTCPKPSNDVDLCTEGRSLLPLFEDTSNPEWDETIFWQYSRNGFMNKIVPYAMGYTIRVPDFRYTEYIQIENLGNLQYAPKWDSPVDHEELYDLSIDPQENVNRYDDPIYKDIKVELSRRLREGWQTRNSNNELVTSPHGFKHT